MAKTTALSLSRYLLFFLSIEICCRSFSLSYPPRRTAMCDTSDFKNERAENDYSLSYIEFYAGVGGWTMALQEALCEFGGDKPFLKRLAAYDHSDLCLNVLEHNFPSQKNSKKRKLISPVDITRLTVSQMQDFSADIWVMSPPCQPHTRQHDKQDRDMLDPRSQSFLHLCKVLKEMSRDKLPKILLMENVVGFEASSSCFNWRKALQQHNYCVAHFHLNPTQVGLPNDRPRYFCMAILKEVILKSDCRDELLKRLSIETDLDKPIIIQTELSECQISPIDIVPDLPSISKFLDEGEGDLTTSLQVPAKVLDSSASWCFDIVTPSDKRSSCFTSAYGKYIRGTGSVLYTGTGNIPSLAQPEERKFQEQWKDGITDVYEQLRYFSGKELARLFGFPPSFSFPSTCTTKQEWKLVGNSLNVRVAARLCAVALKSLLVKP